MMDRELYGQIEQELEKHRVEEDVEDILFGMAEAIADSGTLDEEVVEREMFDGTAVEACGVCESGEDAGVFLKWVKIGKTRIDVEDYFL